MVTFLPAIMVIVWFTDRRVYVDGRTIGWIALFITLGAVQYSYIFWRYQDPGTEYLEMQVPDFQTFFWYVTGGQFTARMFAFSLEEIVTSRIPLLLGFLVREYSFLIPVIITGVITFKNKAISLFLMVSLLGNLIYGLNYDVFDVFVFFIPSYLVLAVYLGQGIAYGIGKGLNWIRSLSLRAALTFTLLAAVPVFFYSINLGRVNQANTTEAAREVEAILQAVGQDAIIIPRDYNQAEFFWYYLIGEGHQRDSIYLMYYGNPRIPIDADTVVAYVYARKPLYLPLRRKHAPPGLRLYSAGSRHLPLLKQRGLRFKKVNGKLQKKVGYLELMECIP